MTDSDLNNSDLNNSDLNNADLNNADLNNADLNNADLNNADLNNADPNDVDDIVEAASPDNTRRNMALLGGLVVVLGMIGGLYFLDARGRSAGDIEDRQQRALEAVAAFEATQPTPTPAPPAAPTPYPEGVAVQPGEVLVVNRVPGDDYGRLAVRHSDGTRTFFDRTCMRVHIASNRGICISEVGSVVPTYRTTFFPGENPDVDLDSYASALPSRARIAADGSIAAVTAFVTGTSYTDVGGEATTIVTFDSLDTNERLRGASQFTVDSSEPGYGNLDAQYWGPTFAPDNDELYITGFYGEYPEIMHGSLDELTIEPTGWKGSCPSLSPDGKTLVFKSLREDGGFDLVAVDVASGDRWTLGEMRSVDDQVEWLDNDTILYAVHPDGGDTPVQPEFDIWMLDIAEGSESVLFLPNADSPAVSR